MKEQQKIFTLNAVFSNKFINFTKPLTTIHCMNILRLFLLSVCMICLNIYADQVKDIAKSGDKALQANNYDQAIKEYDKLKNIYHNNKDDKRFPELLFKGGGICYDANRFIEALDFYTLCLESARHNDDKSIQAATMGNIASIYAMFEDYDRSVYYYERGLEKATEINDSGKISKFAISLMMGYCFLNQPQKAHKYLELQKQYPMEDKDIANFYILFSKGVIAAKEKKYKTAMAYLNKAHNEAQKNNLPSDFALSAQNEIGLIYVTTGQTQKAIECYENYKSVVAKFNRPDLLSNAYKQLGYLYRSIGKHDAEYECFSKLRVIYDSLYNTGMFIKAQYNLQNYENKEHNKTVTLLTKKVNTGLLIISIIMFFFIILLILFIIIYRQKRRQDESYRRLIEKSAALDEAYKMNETIQDKYMKARQQESGKKSDDEDTTQNKRLLKEDQEEILLERIIHVMRNKDFIFQPDCSLPMLAREIGTNEKYASFIINNTYHKNFKTLLNEYRLFEACRLLRESDMHIQAIAIQTGYNSSSSFIKIFKNIMGMTPSTYRRISLENKEGEEEENEEEQQ